MTALMAQAQFRLVFDPAGVFIVRKPLRLSGKDIPAGKVFPSEAVTPRRLEQLFNYRHIAYEAELAAGAVFRPPAPGPAVTRDGAKVAEARAVRRPPGTPAAAKRGLPELLKLLPKKAAPTPAAPAAAVPLDDRVLAVLRRLRTPISAMDLAERVRGGDPEFEPEHMGEAVTLALERLRRAGLALKMLGEDEGRRVARWEATPIIPDDWRDLAWPQMLALASRFSSVKVSVRLEAEAAIEAELMRRARSA